MRVVLSSKLVPSRVRLIRVLRKSSQVVDSLGRGFRDHETLAVVRLARESGFAATFKQADVR